MTKTSKAKNDSPIVQQFVFGLDNGKPVGARFPSTEHRIGEIVKARNLELHQTYNDDGAALGMQLPVGRVYARGKSFIPSIKQALYDKLKGTFTSQKEHGNRAQADPNTTAAEGAAKAGVNKDDPTGATPIASGYPKSWDEIAPGHLVLAQESLPDGWWEALVVSRENDILTLRYRDYPKAPKFTRHIATIAMINPGPT
jgi:hypothetical protein